MEDFGYNIFIYNPIKKIKKMKYLARSVSEIGLFPRSWKTLFFGPFFGRFLGLKNRPFFGGPENGLFWWSWKSPFSGPPILGISQKPEIWGRQIWGIYPPLLAPAIFHQMLKMGIKIIIIFYKKPSFLQICVFMKFDVFDHINKCPKKCKISIFVYIEK